jgi:hypothetical protein
MKVPGQMRPRRVAGALMGLVAAVLAIYVVTRLAAFAQLFGIFRPHAGPQVTQGDIAALHTSPDPRQPVMPRILHQIFHNWKDPGNATLPPHWEKARQSCVDKNPDWEFKVSGADMSLSW